MKKFAVSFCGLFLFLLFFAASSLYWSDSGEFIISAFYLDVAHPPGYPLYATLANLFALLPLGPIAWRVHCFSSFIAALNLVLLFILTSKVLRILGPAARHSDWIAALAPLLLLGSEAFVKQVLTAEAYLLNCTLLLALWLIYLQYRASKDARWLICLALLAGLSAGNHISVGLIYVLMLPLLIADLRRQKKAFWPALLAAFLGLGIYAYLPVRAANTLPLNTGQPSNAERFLSQISDARDRFLRLPDSHVKSEPQNAMVAALKADFDKLASQIGLFTCYAAILGLALLALHSWQTAYVAVAIALGNWFFFQGWYPDPWTPLCCVFAVGFCVLVHSLLDVLAPKEYFPPLLGFAPVFFIVLAFVLSGRYERVLRLAADLRDLTLPKEYAATLLSALPPQSVFVVENSWFLVKYLREIEGYRPDISLAYQPALLFPEFFQTQLFRKDDKFFSGRVAQDMRGHLSDPYFNNLNALVQFTVPQYSFAFEPGLLINEYFSKVAIAHESGVVYLESGKGGLVQPGYALRQARALALFRPVLDASAPALRSETRAALELFLPSAADLLEKLGEREQAVSLLKSVCFPFRNYYCSGISTNNLSVYLYRQGKYLEAAKLALLSIISKNGKEPQLKDVLKTVIPHLTPKELSYLSSLPYAAELISGLH